MRASVLSCGDITVTYNHRFKVVVISWAQGMYDIAPKHEDASRPKAEVNNAIHPKGT